MTGSSSPLRASAVSALAGAIERSGLRKDRIAELAGVKPWTLSRWLSGEVTPPPEKRAYLAGLLRERVEDLFPEIEG